MAKLGGFPKPESFKGFSEVELLWTFTKKSPEHLAAEASPEWSQ